MSTDERPTDERDAQLIRSIRDAYSAPELTPSRRVAMDAKIRERVERRRRFRFVAGLTLSAALAASLVVMVRATRVSDEPNGAPTKIASAPAQRDTAPADSRSTDLASAPGEAPAEVAAAPAAGTGTVVAAAPPTRTASDTAWADSLLFDPAGDDDARERLRELPDEYLAITDVLLEGDDA
jgi:hypothetical protein